MNKEAAPLFYMWDTVGAVTACTEKPSQTVLIVHLHPECKCNGHAKSCHFSRGLWLATGRRSGGVCDDCSHDTEGRHCQNCKKGFFRDPGRPKTAPDSCKRKSAASFSLKPSLYLDECQQRIPIKRGSLWYFEDSNGDLIFPLTLQIRADRSLWYGYFPPAPFWVTASDEIVRWLSSAP